MSYIYHGEKIGISVSVGSLRRGQEQGRIYIYILKRRPVWMMIIQWKVKIGGYIKGCRGGYHDQYRIIVPYIV